MTPEASARSAAVLLAMALTSWPAQAQTAQRPRFEIGDRSDFAVYHSVPATTPSGTWIIKSVSADRIEGTAVPASGRQAVELRERLDLSCLQRKGRAFKLVAKGRLSGKSPIGSIDDATSATTYWYAPRARTIVKSVHHSPYLGATTVELVSFLP